MSAPSHHRLKSVDQASAAGHLAIRSGQPSFRHDERPLSEFFTLSLEDDSKAALVGYCDTLTK
jgi:hypothetical protein